MKIGIFTFYIYTYLRRNHGQQMFMHPGKACIFMHK